MTPQELLEKHPVENADMLEILRRGTAETLYLSQNALILRETGSGSVFFWAGQKGKEDERAARAALPFLPKTGLFCAHGEVCRRLVAGWAGCTGAERCIQACWRGPLPPEPEIPLRSLGPADAGLVLAHYHTVDDEGYVRARVASGEMLGAFLPAGGAGAGGKQNGKHEIAGFIGLHAEGGIGLLEVFEPWRRQGVAAALVMGMVRRQMQKGAIPFGQIIEGNEPSLRLQKKLGFSFSGEPVYWMS